jgi:hypothetical protein
MSRVECQEAIAMQESSRRNVGRADRLLRAVLGVIALALVFTGPRTPWGYIGILLLVTSAISFCPLYALIGVSTRARSTS